MLIVVYLWVSCKVIKRVIVLVVLEDVKTVLVGHDNMITKFDDVIFNIACQILLHLRSNVCFLIDIHQELLIT